MRHWSTELRKQVLPMLASPDPTDRGCFHFISNSSGSYNILFGWGRPSTYFPWSPREPEELGNGGAVSMAAPSSSIPILTLFRGLKRARRSSRYLSGWEAGRNSTLFEKNCLQEVISCSSKLSSLLSRFERDSLTLSSITPRGSHPCYIVGEYLSEHEHKTQPSRKPTGKENHSSCENLTVKD